MSLETGVSNFGKTEACPARLAVSLAPQLNHTAPPNIHFTIQRTSLEMG